MTDHERVTSELVALIEANPGAVSFDLGDVRLLHPASHAALLGDLKEMLGVGTSRDRVLKRWPNAHPVRVVTRPFGWVIAGYDNKFFGDGPTESAAWANAAERLDG